MGQVQFSCPSCRKNVIVDGRYVGLSVACPSCLTNVTVPLQATPYVPPELAGPPKTPDGLPYKRCPFCTEYVSPHALKCSHCNRKLDGEQAPSTWQIRNAGPKTSRLAIASLVLGLLPITPLPSLLAIIFGHMSMRQVRKSPILYKGSGLGMWGAFFGYTFVIGYILAGIIWMVGW